VKGADLYPSGLGVRFTPKLMVKYVLLSLGVVGLLVFGSGVASQSSGPASQQERFVVRVPEDFPTIQAAIDAVAEGGTVLIGPGLYKENIQITKSIRLVGAGQERVQIQYKDPDHPIIDISSGATIPLQIYIQDLTIGDPTFPIEQVVEPPTPTSPRLTGKGLEIYAFVQIVLRRVMIAGLASGVSGLAAVYGFASSQIILEEVSLAKNGVGLSLLGVQIFSFRSKIEENIVGIIVSDQLILFQSSVSKNRNIGIGFGIRGIGEPKHIGHIRASEFMQNGIGISLAASREGHWILIRENRFVQNEKYGIVIQDPACPISPLLPSPAKSALVWVEGGGNEFHNNGQDLCPPDYPWPPGFRK